MTIINLHEHYDSNEIVTMDGIEYAELSLIIDGSSGNRDLENHVAKVFQHQFEIFKYKQKSYGSTNISTIY